MAEYKEFHCPYGDDYEGGDECDRCEQYELCMETPSADVVERSKINNAIKEIKEMQSSIQLKDNHTNEYNVFVDKFDVLAILKRNIGEVNE